jgi:hypothetical protein
MVFWCFTSRNIHRRGRVSHDGRIHALDSQHLGGATAGALLALPLVLLMVAFQERKGLALRARIRAALPAWALCAVVMAGVGAIGESIGGWAGWMIGGMLVGAVGGRFLETQ